MKGKLKIFGRFLIAVVVISIGIKMFFNPQFYKWVTSGPTTSSQGLAENGGGDRTIPRYVELPTQGEITDFIPGRWYMVAKNYDPRKRIDVTLKTEEKLISCKARYDGKNSRIVPLFASNIEQNNYDENSSELSNLEIKKGFNTIEISVDPGQDTSTFKALWVIGPALRLQ